MKSIKFISNFQLEWVVSLLRCTQPSKIINTSESNSTSHCEWNGNHKINIDADIIVLYRLELNPQSLLLLLILRLTGKRIFYSTDDLTFSMVVVPKEISPYRRLYLMWRVFGRALIIRCCDGLIVSTPSLAQYGTKLNHNIYILRNRIPLFFPDISSLPKPDMTRPPMLGYFSGSKTHNKDFALIVPALIDIMREFPEVRLLLVGFLETDSQLDEFQDRVERVDFVPFKELPQLFVKITLNLAPLRLNDFTYSKSEIKITEPGYCNVLTLASKTPAYVTVARHAGVDLLVDNTREAWYAKIKYYLTHDTARKIAETRLLKYVSSTYNHKVQKVEWDKFIDSIPPVKQSCPLRFLLVFYHIFHRLYARLRHAIRNSVRLR